MGKWLVFGVVLLIVLVCLYSTGAKSVHQELYIPAQPVAVWEVLMDTGQYPKWNPVMQVVKGTLEEGTQVTYKFTQDATTSSEISVNVRKLERPYCLNQVGGLPGVLRFDHRYKLVNENEGTRVIIHESYRGIYVNFWNPQLVESAYGRLIAALKSRVESLK